MTNVTSGCLTTSVTLSAVITSSAQRRCNDHRDTEPKEGPTGAPPPRSAGTLQRGASEPVVPSVSLLHPCVPCELISPNHGHFPASNRTGAIHRHPAAYKRLRRVWMDGTCVLRGRGRSAEPRSPRLSPEDRADFCWNGRKKMAVWRCLEVGKEVCVGGGRGSASDEVEEQV